MRAAALAAGLLWLGAHLAFGGGPLENAPPAYRARGNPFDGQEAARRAGAKLFRRECAACHEAPGVTRAPSLHRPQVYEAPPGALFWVLRNGSLNRGMPSFAHLPPPQLWQIVTYLRGQAKEPQAKRPAPLVQDSIKRRLKVD